MVCRCVCGSLTAHLTIFGQSVFFFSTFDPAASQNLTGHTCTDTHTQRDRQTRYKDRAGWTVHRTGMLDMQRSVLTVSHSYRLPSIQHAAVRAPTSSSTRRTSLPVSTRPCMHVSPLPFPLVSLDIVSSPVCLCPSAVTQ